MDLVDGTTVQVIIPNLPIIRAVIPDSTYPVMLVPGPPGPIGPGVTGYTHTQTNPAASWPINHNLGRYPQVTVVDSAGNRRISDVVYTNINNVSIIHSEPLAGAAYLA